MYVLDANILIDFMASDSSVLEIFSRHVGQIQVPIPILDEVKTLDESQCSSLGLVLHEPTFEDVYTASVSKGPLSFEDHVCFLVSQRNNWICVTNEKPLRGACDSSGIQTIRGLRMLIMLVQQNLLDKGSASNVAKEIHRTNPKHIHGGILADFHQEIGMNLK